MRLNRGDSGPGGVAGARNYDLPHSPLKDPNILKGKNLQYMSWHKLEVRKSRRRLCLL
jgi:hypothetical protein